MSDEKIIGYVCIGGMSNGMGEFQTYRWDGRLLDPSNPVDAEMIENIKRTMRIDIGAKMEHQRIRAIMDSERWEDRYNSEVERNEVRCEKIFMLILTVLLVAVIVRMLIQ